MIARALEPMPLLVAAVIGAVGLSLLMRNRSAWMTGALLGAGVQVGVRLAGVS